ncbi:uncharacterized protein LOC110712740 [Chenopodium quinoa]|uniref:uncharacterized protein LOC110712740 n=1 Tax=Chenopodium quinoa TaxID=63459 RepID=UPI000B78B95E|nr:uncharacterized protein LOC110712740 [Chenopodium quinoa]
MVYVVEFQKRGLPHAHFLIILKSDWKLKCPVDYDKYVCAEIPPVSNSNLRRTFSNDTSNNKDGYPIYQRRDTGEQVKIRNTYLDNQWVIPYNPYLSSLFDCHLNVEVCSTIKAVKYLYTYVYKGHDKVSFNIVPGESDCVDEIKQFQSGRWVSPCEAAWRIFSFDLFEMHPPVLPLQVHFPNEQTVHLHPHERLRAVVANSKRSRTQLTEFFAVNAAVEGGTGYLYGEFCEHYRWDAGTKQWKERVLDLFSVGCLAFVYPAEGERFFLRLLLLNVRSPTSFEGLRTVNGHVYPTFYDAALKLGLIENDNVADLTLCEASEVQMPDALRRLFATILIFCQTADPPVLWKKFYPFLSEDFRYKYANNDFRIQHLTVRSVEGYLEAMGKSLSAFGLDHLIAHVDAEIRRTKDIVDALDAPIPPEILTCRSRLNHEQNAAFSCIMQYVMDGKLGAFFIDGPGGTGKTFLYNALYAELRLMNKIVLPTATSGIAASNIPSGRTAHSRFKIPLDSDASLACAVPKQGSLAALLRETSLIIWDEASMDKKQNIESLDLLL